MSGDPTAAQEWRNAYERVTQLAYGAGDSGLEVMVPAAPAWSSRDLLSHMVGVGVDAVAGDVPDDLNDDWTAGQVQARAGATTDQLLAEWAGKADEIEKFIAETATDPLGDVIIHEQDLRTALQQPGARDTGGFAAVRDVMVGKFGEAVGEAAASGPLVLRATDDAWTWSSGEGEPAAVVEAPVYDLSRAITSRRTAEQLRGWTTSGSVDPFLPAFAHLGPLPEDAPHE